MDSYKIEWRNSTRRDIRRIAREHVSRIVAAVSSLADNPRPAGCTKLSGSERAYRIRVGDYRIVYEVFDEAVYIEVIKVGHRRDVYR